MRAPKDVNRTTPPTTDDPRVVGGLSCAVEQGIMTIRDVVRDHRLAIMPLAGSCAPVLDGVMANMAVISVEWIDAGLVVHQAGPGLLVSSTWRMVDDHLEIASTCTVTAACELNRLHLFPSGTILNLWDIVNFRNRHYCPSAWPEQLLGGAGCETDTYSTDWQFAPHPTMMILRKGDDQLFIGTLELSTAYGMYVKVANHRVAHWYLDYGPVGHGQRLAAGETVVMPRFAVYLDRRGSVAMTLSRWTDLLVAQGAIPDPQTVPRFAWHREPMYCTWMDQCNRATIRPPEALQDQAAQVEPAVRILDQAMVREALAVIRRERLPIRTILIDDGWGCARGDWRAHPDRFPDLRGLVDEIHALGMKVIVWWGWPEVAKSAVVDPRYLIGGGTLNRHGMRMYDYTSPTVQREYVRPLFRKLMSSEPDCYDIDGVKTDFMADKVHSDMPPEDVAWRGEENFFHRFYTFFHDEMLRHKPDACHVGCSGHPWLAHVTEINRTFDVWSTDVREHECRGLMLEATSPGCPVALDLHNFNENQDAWIELGRRHAWSYQVGNILTMRRDPFARPEPADAAFFEQIRRGLGT